MNKSLLHHLLIAAGVLVGMTIVGIGVWIAAPRETERSEDILLVDKNTLLLHLANAVPSSASGKILSFPLEQPSRASLPTSLPLAFRTPLLVLAVSDPSHSTAAVRALLGESMMLPMRGTLEAALRTLFGREFSLTYDLVPLLKEQTILEWGREDDQNVFLLSGAMNNSSSLTTTLASLHRFFREAHPSIVAEHRAFAVDKIFDDVSEGSGAQEQVIHTIDGWDIQATHAAQDSARLITAQRGSSFIITTASGALEAYLHATYGSVPLPASATDSVLAGGIFDAKLKGLVDSFLPHPLPPLSGMYRWSVSEARGMGFMRIAR